MEKVRAYLNSGRTLNKKTMLFYETNLLEDHNHGITNQKE